MTDTDEAQRVDNEIRYTTDWLTANDRIEAHPLAALQIARHYGRDWATGRRTAVCAASLNTPLWQRAVANHYPPTVLRILTDQPADDTGESACKS